jgi:hypothetical protein
MPTASAPFTADEAHDTAWARGLDLLDVDG